tara:strand:- start:538 stop:1371 length:834 start_codon:yes stop_codon:yes gene_type:complete
MGQWMCTNPDCDWRNARRNILCGGKQGMGFGCGEPKPVEEYTEMDAVRVRDRNVSLRMAKESSSPGSTKTSKKDSKKKTSKNNKKTDRNVQPMQFEKVLNGSATLTKTQQFVKIGEIESKIHLLKIKADLAESNDQDTKEDTYRKKIRDLKKKKKMLLAAAASNGSNHNYIKKLDLALDKRISNSSNGSGKKSGSEKMNNASSSKSSSKHKQGSGIKKSSKGEEYSTLKMVDGESLKEWTKKNQLFGYKMPFFGSICKNSGLSFGSSQEKQDFFGKL